MDSGNGASDRTLLYNQDPGVLFSETAEPIEPAHVDGMVDEVADAGVDVLLVNVNMWRTNYPGDAWETWWEGFAEWAAENPPLETPGMGKTLHWHHPRHPKRHRMIEQMERLASGGCDYLERSLARCRERGVTPGASVRMNDRHDADPDSQYFSEFYRDHPELRLETDRPAGTGGLDYERAAVRDHFAVLIAEVVDDYDVDVLELDFLRHPPFFAVEGPDASAKAPVMTDFLARVAGLCEAESVALVPRVPATPANALERGLDVEAWADRGLIDGLIAGTAIRVDWQLPVDAWRAVLGELPLHVSIDKWADDPPGLPRREIPDDERLLRGVGGAYAATAADGLYVFNFFGPRERPLDPGEPAFGTLPDVKRDDRLRGAPKTYLATSVGEGLGRDHSPAQVPLVLDAGESRAVSLWLLAEPPEASITVRAVVARTLAAEDLWLQVGNVPVGPADEVREYARPGYRGEPARSARQAVFGIPAERLSSGENRFAFRNRTTEALTLRGVEVHVE
jgi:hypothetical protein